MFLIILPVYTLPNCFNQGFRHGQWPQVEFLQNHRNNLFRRVSFQQRNFCTFVPRRAENPSLPGEGSSSSPRLSAHKDAVVLSRQEALQQARSWGRFRHFPGFPICCKKHEKRLSLRSAHGAPTHSLQTPRGLGTNSHYGSLHVTWKASTWTGEGKGAARARHGRPSWLVITNDYMRTRGRGRVRGAAGLQHFWAECVIILTKAIMS